MRGSSSLLLTGLLGLSACVSSTETVCVPIVPYDAATQKSAAQELRNLPADSVLGRMIIDYGIERSELRACAGK